MDLEQAIDEWNMLQATLRQAGCRPLKGFKVEGLRHFMQGSVWDSVR